MISRNQLKDVTRIVIKLGTGVITNSDKHPDLPRMVHLASQVNNLRRMGKEVIIVSSGAVAAGRHVLGFKKKPSELADLQACAAVGQCSLMSIYQKLFSIYGINIAQVLLTHDDLEDHDRYLNVRSTLQSLIQNQIVPIINENDTVSVEELKFGDNDRLSALVASLPYSVATLHSLFNITNTLILIWFVPQIERIVRFLVPSQEGEEEEFKLQYIKGGPLGIAELSLNEARHEIVHFGEVCCKGFGHVREAINETDPDNITARYDKLKKYEGITDMLEYEIAAYLGEVAKGEISEDTTKKIKSMYKIIGEMESLGDSGETIGRMLERAHAHGKTFSPILLRKLNHMMDLVQVAYDAMMHNLNVPERELRDINNALDAEYSINEYRNNLREEHIVNLEKANYEYQTGVFYMDIVSEFEKMGDFIINISQALLPEYNEY